MSKENASRRAPTPSLDMAALKFIRMVMASYFMAVALGVISGFEPAVFFSLFLSPDLASTVGSAVVLHFAVLMFFGLFLRLASLYLAIVVLTSALVTHVVTPDVVAIDRLWHEVVLIGGLMLSYCTLSESQLRRQAFIRPRAALRRRITGKVVPRRIARGGAPSTPKIEMPDVVLSFARMQERAAEATRRGTAAPDPAASLRRRETPVADKAEDEVENIFAVA